MHDDGDGDDAVRRRLFVVPRAAQSRASVLVDTAACDADTAADSDDGETTTAAALRQARRLLAAYGAENARLRARLRACVCRDACALEAAAATSATPTRNVVVTADDDDDAAQTCGSSSDAGASAVRRLQLRVCELQGQVRGYEEALRQQQAAAAAATRAPDDAARRGNGAVTCELLKQCLRTADYLVKVCNACAHCRDTPHGLATHCPRTRAACTRHCLRAAARGSSSDGDEGNDDNDISTLAHTLRDELLYCETMVVRLAAAQLLDGDADARGIHIDNGRDGDDGRDDDDVGECEVQ